MTKLTNEERSEAYVDIANVTLEIYVAELIEAFDVDPESEKAALIQNIIVGACLKGSTLQGMLTGTPKVSDRPSLFADEAERGCDYGLLRDIHVEDLNGHEMVMPVNIRPLLHTDK